MAQATQAPDCSSGPSPRDGSGGQEARQDGPLDESETAAVARPTAFRQAEKRYQLRREQVFRNRNGRRYGAGLRALPTDLSDVLDVTLLDEFFATTSCCHDGPVDVPHSSSVSLLEGQDVPPSKETSRRLATTSGVRAHVMACSNGQQRILSFGRFPGLYLLPGAIDQAKQQSLVSDCLIRLPEPPSHSNHTAHLGPLPSMWDSALKGLRLVQQRSVATCYHPSAETESANPETRHRSYMPADGGEERVGPTWALSGRGSTALHCLDKLRWITLGPQFDWTQRVYDMDGPHQPLPELIQRISHWAAEAALRVETELGREGWQGKFDPEACLVNYYGEGDTLNGHRDDVEPNQTLPIISISLGRPAVFLMGGESLHVSPLPMMLWSGDVVVLGAQARRCYHGVPRVLACGKLDKSFREAARQGPDAAMRDYLSRKRINLSVRTIT